MLWSMRRYSLLEQDDEEWQLDCWAWLIGNLGGLAAFHDQPLIVPTTEFFRRPQSRDDPAEHYFSEIIRLTAMECWPFKLVEQESPINPILSPSAIVQNAPSDPVGTFSAKRANEILISYSPDLLERPEDLIATFVHEISHGLVRSIEQEPPGGWECEEYATDLTVAFLGFGIFGANSAFRFNQYSDGWSFRHSGYLSQLEWSFALAVFLSLKGEDTEQANRFLNDGPAASLKKCMKYVGKFPECLDTIRNGIATTPYA